MSSQIRVKSSITAEPVARYVIEKITTDSKIESALRAETYKLSQGGMISGPDVGALLSILAKSIGAKMAIEIGTFTGYTALKIAQALPSNGKLICCDVSEEWTAIGRRFWAEANVSGRIDLRIAPAIETLNSLISSGRTNAFDFAFIDADKTGYDAYYEACLELIRPDGLIVLDNMLWHGAVADLAEQDETTKAIRGLNEKISRDSRVESSLVTIGDGVMIARKKAPTG